MKLWSEFQSFEKNIIGKKSKLLNNVFSFDIETSSIFILDGNVFPTLEYKDLDKKTQERCIFQSFMYIWQFSIDNDVYYGRTWSNFRKFLDRLDLFAPEKKIVFVHNLSFEFQFLHGNFNFHDVMARKSRHVMKAYFDDYNIEMRCSYMMSNVALAVLPKVYKLDVQKMSGDLDYSKIRTPETPLTSEELKYCENDCLVVYKYILRELETYVSVDKIPMTFIGHVRKELKKITYNDWKYKKQTRKAINTDPIVYNRLLEAFQGGYTHSNWFYTGEVLHDVDSYDFTSSYPFVMVSEKYPMTDFKICKLRKAEDMLKGFAYLLRVRFKNIKSKYLNNFISMSKCRHIRGATYDNGRIVKASELEMTLTDIDFRLILSSYSGTYEILESYYSMYKYLPEKFYKFILEKYIEKTKLKNVEGREVEYALSKNMFNSLYGMSVTNTIRDEVVFDNDTLWSENELDNLSIILKLQEEKQKGFLSFSWRSMGHSICKTKSYSKYNSSRQICCIL